MSNLALKLCVEGTVIGTPSQSWAQIATTIVDALFKDCDFTPVVMAQIIILLHESLVRKVKETPMLRTVVSLKDEIEKEWVTKRTYNCIVRAHTSVPYSPNLHNFERKLNLELSGEGKDGTVVVSLRLEGGTKCKPTAYDPQTLLDTKFVPLPAVDKRLAKEISDLRAKTKTQIEPPRDLQQEGEKKNQGGGILRGLFSGMKTKD